MGQSVSRIHSKKDDKVYNILSMGEYPTVVFGRSIKSNSMPGMQYYFRDGRVKWVDDGQEIGYSFYTPFKQDGSEEKWGTPCIFTVPENFDFSKITNPSYIEENSRTAQFINANTMSPFYIIRNGELLCIKKLEDGGQAVAIQKKKFAKSKDGDDYHMLKITRGKVFGLSSIKGNYEKISGENMATLRNSFVVAPIGRVKYKHKITSEKFPDGITFVKGKESIYHYNFKKYVVHITGDGEGNLNKEWCATLM